MTSTQTSPAQPSLAHPGHPAWTCPFCALLCDDLGIKRGEHLALQGSRCPRATRALTWFDPQAVTSSALIDGKAATLADALDHAARLLAGSRQPMFGGLATDVAGMRALYALADRSGAILDHAHGDSLLHSMRALQDRGAFTTTLAEIRNRADLIVCLGTQPTQKHPEFFRRCGMTDGGQAPARNLVFVGTGIDPAALALPNTRISTVATHDDLYQTVAALNALCRPRPLTDEAAMPAELRELAAHLKAAQYAVLVWSPSTLDTLPGGAHTALLIEGIYTLVKALNRSTRAGGFPLGGDDGANTANYVTTWLSGLPLRTGVHRSGLAHDPHRYRTDRLLQNAEVDCLLWVASFTPELAPPPAAQPTVTLGHPALAAAMASRAGVFIPVSTPGIGSAGHLFRTDGGVVLPLVPAYDDGLPAVAHIARQLLERLPQRAAHATGTGASA